MISKNELNISKHLQFLLDKIVKMIHNYTISERRIRRLIHHFSQLLSKDETLFGLDVGSGSGELAHYLEDNYPNLKLSGVDVVVRKNTFIEVTKFDGEKLPFEDKSYDFVMLVDVLHHTDHPQVLLSECVRVSRKFILIKDHICNSWFDKACLSFMDWIGNRGYDAYFTYNYLSKNQWEILYNETGIVNEIHIEDLNLYPQPFSLIFDRSLHFIAKLKVLS